ncbi:hypothetical protein ACHAW6_006175 [Cyclotella cf. meneghiniana]
MCTTEQTFAWVGAIIVNAAFISIIAWGASTIWYVGFILSAIYTAILLGLAWVVDKKSAWDAVPTNDDDFSYDLCTCNDGLQIETGLSVPPRKNESSRSIIKERRMPVLANFLYGLFAVSLSVTGFFIPVNIYSCDLDDDSDDCWRKQSIVFLFVRAIPILLASILLWIKRNAPSMAITCYLGLSDVAISLCVAIVGQSHGIENFWRWWYSISGGLYVVILSDLSYCKRLIARSPLMWGINFGALAFLVGMIFLTGIIELPGAWPWVIFNALALLPLGIVGLGHNLVFLLVLCALGWLMTTLKIASAIAASVSSAEVPIYSIVLAISGLLIAGAGWSLNKHQDEIQWALSYHMERISLSRRFLPEVESDEHPATVV